MRRHTNRKPDTHSSWPPTYTIVSTHIIQIHMSIAHTYKHIAIHISMHTHIHKSCGIDVSKILGKIKYCGIKGGNNWWIIIINYWGDMSGLPSKSMPMHTYKHTCTHMHTHINIHMQAHTQINSCTRITTETYLLPLSQRKRSHARYRAAWRQPSVSPSVAAERALA